MDTNQDQNRQYRILIADDNVANRELLEAYLAEIDCVVDIAEDGQETIDKAQSFQPDLILLDVMMPKFSGFEVCEKIKSDEQLKKIMVLMVTALNELGDVERAVDAGTNDFLSKPVNRLTLIKRVENLLALKDVTDENERLRQYIQRVEES
jgi:two-component system alkaline phosphatase synthesis response regulator PhoP